MSILCKIGLHKWEYTDAVWIDRILGITKIPATRTCKRCGKVQEQDVHCLGLNPPEYSYTWYNVLTKMSEPDNMESSERIDYEKTMKDYFKPRNEHLHEVLMGRKCGAHDGKKGTKRQSRAKCKAELRERMRDE